MNKEEIDILRYSNDDITQILIIVTEIATEKMESEDAPWLRNMYFAGRTLWVDTNLPDREDSYTFCLTDESVGYASGGLRRLLSIESCKLLKNLLKISEIKHEPKWLV